MKHLIFAAVSFALIASFGCEPAITTIGAGQNALPPAKTAMINIFSSSSERAYGCLEPAGVSIPAGTPLICSVPVGYQVTFYYADTGAGIPNSIVKHQIVPVGNTEIPASSVSDPSDNIPVLVDVVNSTKTIPAGTYGWQDAFDSQINGQLVFF
jgi:hypothetical protein